MAKDPSTPDFRLIFHLLSSKERILCKYFLPMSKKQIKFIGKMHRKNQCSTIGHLSYRRNETESVELLPLARPNPTKSEKRNQLMQIQKADGGVYSPTTVMEFRHAHCLPIINYDS